MTVTRTGRRRQGSGPHKTGPGLSSPLGLGVVDSPVNRLFNPLKVNKEGVDKCFLMEFLHVMGKSVHTLGDFGAGAGAGAGRRQWEVSSLCRRRES